MNRRFQRWLTLGLLGGLLWMSASPTHAQRRSYQTELKPVSTTYALTNATVITAPGKTLEGGTVIIKDGLIEAVGNNVSIPPNATRIAADSLFVYPGFIDGLSETGVNPPKGSEERERVKNPGQPPRDLAGIQPDRSVMEMLDPTHKSVEELRELGFTLVHAVPEGRMLPGTGALILLTGEAPEEMVLKEQAAMFAQFRTARNIYPETIIGLMAKWRNLYRQAEQMKAREAAYAENARGLQRPETSPVLQAFYPVIDRQMPVFFKAESVKEVHRALTLQEELGFSLVLAEVKQAWDVVDELKAKNMPFFMSLDLPENPEKEQKGKDNEEAEEAPSEEIQAMLERQMTFYKRYYEQAAAATEAGLTFGFSTFDAKPKDIRKRLRTLVEHGMSEEQVLAALTTTPASMLGIASMVGTVETGKIANLVITDKPYFDEESNVRMVFVDGDKYEYDVKEKKKGNPDAKVDAPGEWSYTSETPQGTSEGIITLEGDPSNLGGSITNSMLEAPLPLENVVLEGNSLSFAFSVDAGGQNLRIRVSAIIVGDAMEGSMEVGEYGTYELTAERQGTPR